MSGCSPRCPEGGPADPSAPGRLCGGQFPSQHGGLRLLQSQPAQPGLWGSGPGGRGLCHPRQRGSWDSGKEREGIAFGKNEKESGVAHFYIDICNFCPVLWIQIHWIWIRILNFSPLCIDFQGYDINFEKKNSILTVKKKISSKIFFCQLSLWMVNFVLNLTPFACNLSYFACVDPYSECGSRSSKLLKTDSIWIRFQITVFA